MSLTDDGMPKEILQMIAAGVSVRDILSFCQADRQLDRKVCQHPEFYRTLRRRDFPDWNFCMAPEEILPMEAATRDDDWLDGVPVYWGPFSTKLRGRSNTLLGKARLPGSGNTVKIHDRDYIFYYFMWAPRDHKWVNYDKKFTDAEILEDIKNNQPIHPNLYPKDSEGNIRVEYYRPGPLGLSTKRKNLLLARLGILQSGINVKYLPLLASRNLDSEEKMEEEGITRSFFSYFREPLEYNIGYFTAYLYPRALKDLSLAYDSFNLKPTKYFSLAFLAALDARDKSTLSKEEYANLVRRYQIVESLEALEKRLLDSEDDDVVSDEPVPITVDSYDRAHIRLALVNLFEEVAAPHIFPETENLWPTKLEAVLKRMATKLDVPFDE